MIQQRYCREKLHTSQPLGLNSDAVVPGQVVELMPSATVEWQRA